MVKSLIIKPSDILIAWSAGLFEGEGTIFIANIKGYSYPRLEMKMTDSDIIDRFHAIWGGNVRHVPARDKMKKDAYCWQMNNKETCKRIIELMWPYLGERRRLKAKECGLA